jgi:hypothetical protein
MFTVSWFLPFYFEIVVRIFLQLALHPDTLNWEVWVLYTRSALYNEKYNILASRSKASIDEIHRMVMLILEQVIIRDESC